ncbi:MAG: hypothetical protein IPG34_12825 [Rhodocyclaceae bacterium]|nr:hypothetical protein [Rhodocyclaceae bacterium]
MRAVVNLATTVSAVPSGSEGSDNPANIPTTSIAGASFDYQLATLLIEKRHVIDNRGKIGMGWDTRFRSHGADVGKQAGSESQYRRIASAECRCAPPEGARQRMAGFVQAGTFTAPAMPRRARAAYAACRCHGQSQIFRKSAPAERRFACLPGATFAMGAV